MKYRHRGGRAYQAVVGRPPHQRYIELTSGLKRRRWRPEGLATATRLSRSGTQRAEGRAGIGRESVAFLRITPPNVVDLAANADVAWHGAASAVSRLCRVRGPQVLRRPAAVRFAVSRVALYGGDASRRVRSLTHSHSHSTAAMCTAPDCGLCAPERDSELLRF